MCTIFVGQGSIALVAKHDGNNELMTVRFLCYFCRHLSWCHAQQFSLTVCCYLSP